jgi:hypothetical protein
LPVFRRVDGAGVRIIGGDAGISPKTSVNGLDGGEIDWRLGVWLHLETQRFVVCVPV